MTDKRDALFAELKAAITEASQVTDEDGVPTEQRNHVLAVLGEYVACLEHDPPTVADCCRVARIVTEYWPMNLAAGERVVSVEQKLRSFFASRSQNRSSDIRHDEAHLMHMNETSKRGRQ